MVNFYSKYLVLLVSILFYSKGYGQLITNSLQSPPSLVQNVLLGPGVIVSNVMYNGSTTAIGSFTETGTNLGINQGIVMTTGTVANNPSGPQGPNNLQSAGLDNNMGGSNILSNLIGGGATTYNAATLEFDFIPYSDTVKFKYVFGSDEYPEFAPPNNSSYNDVFGFFISGPGIVGMQNIAQLPGNAGIVSINNVNAITNSSFFNDNGDGNMAPYNASPNYIQYDGFTDVLEAVSRVQCGQTYHLVIAVADVTDGSWDSGIFLEANSLSSQTPIDISIAISQQVYTNPDWMAEGCVNAIVTLQRNSNLNSPLTIPIAITGSATNNIDYSGVPTSISFGVGQGTVSFPINVMMDNLTEGLESIILNFTVSDPCGNITPIPITVYIQDVAPLSVTLNDSAVQCPGNSLVLTPLVSGGVVPYTYLWSNGATSSSISITANSTEIYTVSVVDNCLGQTVIDSALITVPVNPPLTLQVSNDITETCPYITHTFYAVAGGGSGTYTFVWKKNNTVISNLDSIVVTPSASSTYIVTLMDNCGNMLSDTVTYTITSAPLIVNVSPTIKICPGDSAYVSASASGGYGNYYYYWPSNGATTTGIWVYPSANSVYQVMVSDECQTFTVNGFAYVNIVKPAADFSILNSGGITEGLPVSFLNQTINGYGYTWDFGDGNSSYDVHPINIYDSTGTYLVTLIATDMFGCTDSITKPIYISPEFYIYIPNSFIPDGNRINEVFQGSFIGVDRILMNIYNRWGELIFSSDALDFAWDGLYRGHPVQDGVYTWHLTYTRPHREEEHMEGHVNVIR